MGELGRPETMGSTRSFVQGDELKQVWFHPCQKEDGNFNMACFRNIFMTPRTVHEPTSFRGGKIEKIAGGLLHTLFLLKKRNSIALFACGSNEEGQLGVGGSVPKFTSELVEIEVCERCLLCAMRSICCCTFDFLSLTFLLLRLLLQA